MKLNVIVNFVYKAGSEIATYAFIISKKNLENYDIINTRLSVLWQPYDLYNYIVLYAEKIFLTSSHFTSSCKVILIHCAGEDSMKIVSEKLDHGFENIKNQAANAEKYSGMEAKPAVYGVVKRMRDNDADIHTNKQVIIV